MEFCLIKSKRKTFCLSVTEAGKIIVRAPLCADEESIENFVDKHRRWIESRLKKIGERRTLSLQNGATLRLFGNDYTVREGRAGITLKEVFLPAAGRERALLNLLKNFAYDKMKEIVSALARCHKFAYSRMRISSARTRWGSCSRKGVLSFSCFLAFVPLKLSEYVAAHELCHTRHFNHGKSFWREVEKIIPDWRVRRAELKKEEDCLCYLRSGT